MSTLLPALHPPPAGVRAEVPPTPGSQPPLPDAPTLADAPQPGRIGHRMRRSEDHALLQGRGEFIDDLGPEGTLHLAFARSSYAHAAIGGVDLEAARRSPGVELVAGPDELRPVAPLLPVVERPAAAPVPREILPSDRTRFVGEALAAVVASDRYAAEDAAERIEIAYTPLEAVASIEAALAEGAPVVQEPGNLVFHEEVETGDVDAAFRDAAAIVERTFRSPRYSAAPMESRGVLAIPDGDRLVVWSSTQIPHMLEEAIAGALGLAAGAVTVRVPDVGGGFGLKAHVFPEEVAVAWAALQLGRPVKWVEDRVENLLASTHAREQVVRARAACDGDGRLLAIDATVHCDIGAYAIHPWGQLLEPLGTPAMIPGPYDLRAFRYRTHAVVTNKCPEGAYRGVGMPVSVIVHERMMDVLAAELGLDRAEIRRRNLVPPERLPYQSVTGLVYDSGDYRAALDRALAEIGYDDFPARQAAARAEGRVLGLGIAAYVEFSGTNARTYQSRGMKNVPGYDAARLRVNDDGTVSLWTSCPAMGQGVATTFRQIAAAHLDVPFEAVVAEILDTSETPHGSGSFASRSAVAGGGALIGVAATLRRRLAEVAARELEASVDDIEVRDGRLVVRGSPSIGLSLAEARAAADGADLDVSESYDPVATTFPYATHVCIVEVDRLTGNVGIERYVVVEDCGPMINPIIVEGQVHGATAQGIGGALFEDLRYGDDGQLLTASFMDYLIPTATDLPGVEIHHLESPAPNDRGGFKGVGEGGTIAAPAAVANAVSDALGIEVNELPVSLEGAVQALRESGYAIHESRSTA